MLSDTEKAWLAGFLDADGMIRLRIGRKNTGKWKKAGPKSLVPLITYTNTCLMTVARIAEMVGRSFTDFSATLSGRTMEKTWAPKTTLEIGGIIRVEPFLKMLRPYLITKATEADLVLMFCDLRNANPRGAYTNKEYQIFEALKYCKKTRHLRDYTPSAEEILGKDIVQASAEALEATEMLARQPIEARREWAKNLVSTYRWNKTGRGK
jgi:hypothetical protein